MKVGTGTGDYKRIETVDVLRGFALAGILYAHMIIWYTGAALPQDVYFNGNGTADYVAFAVFGAFVFGKFYSVFSFLFGLGFYLHFRRKRNTSGYLGVYVWRLFLLFLIGIIHHTFWRGDILAIYAILGTFLLAFRNLSLKWIFCISLLLIINLPNHLYDLIRNEYIDPELTLPMENEAKAYYSLVQNGSFTTNLRENWSSWPAKIKYQFESGRIFMTFGYFLLGLYTGRTRIFEEVEERLQKIQRWNKIAGAMVLLLVVIALFMLLMDYVGLPKIEVVPELKWISAFLFSIYNAFVSLIYITGITLLFRSKFFYSYLKPLAFMGSMALTNYLLQTVFGLLLFYKFGLGLFDSTSPAFNIFIAVIIFFFQLNFSRLWLNYFKQGPVEWVWKSFTNLDFDVNKKKNNLKTESPDT